MWRPGSPSGGSILITSAPWSASTSVRYGPGRKVLKSTTRSPASFIAMPLSRPPSSLARASSRSWLLAGSHPLFDEGCSLEHALGLEHDRVVDERAVQRERGRTARLRLAKRRYDMPRLRDVVGARRKRSVDRLDLARMDAKLALEPERRAPTKRIRETVAVLDVDPREIDRRLDTGGAAREQQRATERDELRLLARPTN